MAGLMAALESPFPSAQCHPLDLQPLDVNPLDLLQPIVNPAAGLDPCAMPFNFHPPKMSPPASNPSPIYPLDMSSPVSNRSSSSSSSSPSPSSSSNSASPASTASTLSDANNFQGEDLLKDESGSKRLRTLSYQPSAVSQPVSIHQLRAVTWPSLASPTGAAVFNGNAAYRTKPTEHAKYQANLELFNSFVKPHLSVPEVLSVHKPRLWRWETLYTRLHQLAEPARVESRTAHLIAGTLRSLGGSFRVWEKVGGHGVVGMYRNGPGPVVALHASMDGMTINEETHLQYKCTRQMRDVDLLWKPTMHASAHDMEVVCLLAAAEALISARNTWSGTLVLIFQPDEDGSGAGAARMVNDGLFQKVGTPDVFLAQRVAHGRAGSIRMRRGLVQPAKDRLRVVINGRIGRTGAKDGIDPIFMAASTAVRLQELARSDIQEEDPFASITVDSLVAGLKRNTRVHEARLLLTVRTVYKEPRERLMHKIGAAIAQEDPATGTPLQPDIRTTARYPSNANDGSTTRRLSETFLSLFGRDYFDANCPLDAGCSSFPVFGASIGKPSCFWFIGATNAQLWDEAVARDAVRREIPCRSSPRFAPVVHSTLAIGIHAVMAAALTFFTPVYQVT